jgi:hypothetical protein
VELTDRLKNQGFDLVIVAFVDVLGEGREEDVHLVHDLGLAPGVELVDHLQTKSGLDL